MLIKNLWNVLNKSSLFLKSFYSCTLVHAIYTYGLWAGWDSGNVPVLYSRGA